MPVLPLLYRRIQAAAAAAEDTRIVDARGLEHALEIVREETRKLMRRIPTISISALRQHNTEGETRLARRQDDNVCNAGYISGCYQGLNAGPSPGAVVGIVLGSVAAFLLLLWVLYTLSNGSGFIRTSHLEEEDVVVNHHGHHGHHHRSRSPNRRSTHRSSYREEMRQTHTSPAPAPRRDRVVRQERISREIPRDVSRSRVRETVIVDESRPERRVEGDDVIEVIAEGSDMTASNAPPRRTTKSSRRTSGYRSVQRDASSQLSQSSFHEGADPAIESGYRRVDPSRFAGGGFKQHRV